LIAFATKQIIPHFLPWIISVHTIEVSAFDLLTNQIPNAIWDGPMKEVQP
jgi:hypothetical protein